MSEVKFDNMGSTSVKARRSRNIAPLTKAVTERYQRLWRDAARVFVITVAETIVSNIRSDQATGMTVASLRPVAAELRIKNQIVGIFTGFGPKYYGYNYEGKGGGKDLLNASHEGSKGNKSKRRGELMGRKAYKITFGTKNRLLMTFEFRAVVWQHLFWEPTWNSIETGRLAMQQFLDNNFDKDEYNVTSLIARWLGD